MWVPGFVLFPLPGQPEWMCDLDPAFWANFLYVAGSVIYVAQGIYWWHAISYPALTEYDDYNPNNPSNYLGLTAAAIFIANALVSFVDWWLCSKQASIMNVMVENLGDEHSDQTKGKFEVEAVSSRILNLYFWNNVFFMGAAVTWIVYQIFYYERSTDVYGCRPREDADDDAGKCMTFWMPFCATSFYLISSLCGMWEFFETARFRSANNMPPLTMFHWDFYQVDWFGWGDWLYLLASILPWCQTFIGAFSGLEGEELNDTVAPIYNMSNFLFLIDSIAYSLGYMMFLREIISIMKKRHDEEERERAKHGNVDHIHSTRDSFSRNYNDEGDVHTAPSSSYVKNAVTKMMLRRENTIPDARNARRASGHGAAVMSMGRSSFSNDQGLVLSPLGGSRASISSGNYPGTIESPRLSGSSRASFSERAIVIEPPPPGILHPVSPARSSVYR